MIPTAPALIMQNAQCSLCIVHSLLYQQFHSEAALCGFLYHLTTLRGEFVSPVVVQRCVGHLLHHEVEGGDERLLAVGDAHGDGAV